MIVVKIIGGLGNQMFQYAFAKALAIKNRTELKLDISEITSKVEKQDFTIRDFELNVFKIDAKIAAEMEVKQFEKSRNSKMFDFVSLYLPFRSKQFYLREPYHHFFSKALTAPSNCYVDGYWQSERYFVSIRDILLKEFKPAGKISDKSAEVTGMISSCNAVSIHVRRGDYVSNVLNNSIHGTCSVDFYYQAIEIIKQKVKDPVFFVFSDDPHWFKENIKTDIHFHIIDHNKGKNSYEDMYLMSLCKHNIIANSSFSWWGAWLNDNANKVVIAPEKWLNNSPKNTKDVLPVNWIKL